MQDGGGGKGGGDGKGEGEEWVKMGGRKEVRNE